MPQPQFKVFPTRHLAMVAGFFLALIVTPLSAQSTWVGTLVGQSSQDQFGASLEGIEDVNGDGVRDILVGAPFDDSGGPGAGAVHVISGLDQSTLYVLTGATPFVEFGRSISNLGDVNGDGVSDFVVGAPFDQWNGVAGGTVRVVSGIDGQVLFTFGATTPGDRLGESVDGVGDVNGDGIPDLALGAPGNDDFDEAAGAVYVRSGADGGLIHTFFGVATNDVFGSSVDGLGDVNLDGRGDILVGAPFEDAQGLNSGSARVFSGLDGSVLFAISGQTAGAQFGSVVLGLGDLNDDEVVDFAVGSPAPGDPNAQDVRVFCGATGCLVHVVTSPQAFAGFGMVMASGGDFDGDNAGDILVGLPFHQLTTGTLVGQAQVISGRDGGVLEVVTGELPGGLFGSAVANNGDASGDGFDDFLVGIPGAGGSVFGAGSVRAYHAPTRPILLYESEGKGTSLSLSWAGNHGDLHATVGTIQCLGATPGALGLFGVSLARADIPLSFGFPILVANDPVNLIGLGSFGFDFSGAIIIPNVSRQNPFLAGTELFIQFFESSPSLACSNGLRMSIAP
ncbi:MAG: hypothetical protein ACI97A_001002 [Planctomycetota bacterium]|jgi:hypothetical protein